MQIFLGGEGGGGPKFAENDQISTGKGAADREGLLDSERRSGSLSIFFCLSVRKITPFLIVFRYPTQIMVNTSY